MAIDQAILEDVSRTGIPTLRFYGWSRPTLSLGYFQSHQLATERYADAERVRRSTGGGAILHDAELTYSLTMPMAKNQTGAREELYRGVHEIVATVLSDRGVTARPYRTEAKCLGDGDAFLCFQRRTDEDLIVSGYKVLGSAQRRTKTAVLQHGSLLLRASRLTPELPGVFDLTSIAVCADEVAKEIALGLSQMLATDWAEHQISAELMSRSVQISAERFQTKKWWTKR